MERDKKERGLSTLSRKIDGIIGQRGRATRKKALGEYQLMVNCSIRVLSLNVKSHYDECLLKKFFYVDSMNKGILKSNCIHVSKIYFIFIILKFKMAKKCCKVTVFKHLRNIISLFYFPNWVLHNSQKKHCLKTKTIFLFQIKRKCTITLCLKLYK